ncbi:MAG: hypothetical protein PHP57_01705 [Sideroxydans sp.]|nr:hypothetical protein [Sideroxydans sp.]
MGNEALQHTAFDGVADYLSALDSVCSSAQRTLNVFDKNFADSGFNSEARYETLRHFLLQSSSNRLQLLAHDTQYLVRYSPRMMILLQEFSHSMAINQTAPHMHNITEPFAVADHTDFVRRFHFDDTRGVLAKNDSEGARILNARFQEMWLASHTGATPTRLGL